MITINKSVGASGGVNLPPDVMTIQKALNGVPVSEGGPSVPLVVDGLAGPKTNGAIKQFQLRQFGGKISDARVDPGGPTLERLNKVSAENVTVTLVTAAGATLIPPLGNPNILHFVAPRAGTNVTLQATITPNHAQAVSAITWVGATPGPANRLMATVPRFPARKQVVQIKKADGTVIQEIRVWVLWTQVTGVPATKEVDPADLGGTRLRISQSWTFIHRITPGTIVTDTDRPALDGPMTAGTNVPGHTKLHIASGNPLAGGANLKWDATRQVKAKFVSPQGHFAGAFPATALVYPVDDAEGNDDTHTDDEDNNPYDNLNVSVNLPRVGRVTIDLRDQLRSNDRPSLPIPHTLGADGDTLEMRAHFREFTRIQLDRTWHRISDFFLWRFHAKARRAAGKWQDDSSDTAPNNAGF